MNQTLQRICEFCHNLLLFLLLGCCLCCLMVLVFLLEAGGIPRGTRRILPRCLETHDL